MLKLIQISLPFSNFSSLPCMQNNYNKSYLAFNLYNSLLPFDRCFKKTMIGTTMISAMIPSITTIPQLIPPMIAAEMVVDTLSAGVAVGSPVGPPVVVRPIVEYE